MNVFNSQWIEKLYLSMPETAMATLASYKESSDWLYGFETHNLDYIVTKRQTHIKAIFQSYRQNEYSFDIQSSIHIQNE